MLELRRLLVLPAKLFGQFTYPPLKGLHFLGVLLLQIRTRPLRAQKLSAKSLRLGRDDNVLLNLPLQALHLCLKLCHLAFEFILSILPVLILFHQLGSNFLRALCLLRGLLQL